jgi:hypothetical protein
LIDECFLTQTTATFTDFNTKYILGELSYSIRVMHSKESPLKLCLLLLMIMKEYNFLFGFLPEIRANYAKIIEKEILKNAVLLTK